MKNQDQDQNLQDIQNVLLQDDEIHIEKYWKIIKSKFHILIIITLLVMGATFLRISSRVPYYSAHGLLMIEQKKDVINFDRFYINDFRNEYFNTQIRILESTSLMKSVRQEVRAITGKPASGSFMIDPIDFTRLVSVRCRSTDGETAATMVNTLFKKFIEFSLDVDSQSSKQVSDYITAQITTVQRNLAQKEEELQKYGKRKELFYLSNKDSTVVEKFYDINKAYTQAQIGRINREATYKELKNLSFSEYPSVKQSQLIGTLKSNYSTIESDYKRKAQVFKDSYPAMTQLRSQMETLQRQIQEETRDIAAKTFKEAQGEYQAALKREESLKNMLTQQKGVVANSKADSIYYNSLDIEVQNLRRLLSFLVKKQKESLVTSRLEGFQTSNIKVIDRAEIPLAPISSSKVKTMLMALIMGLFLGCGLVFVVDYLDRSIKGPDEVKPLLNVPALGIINDPNSSSAANRYANVYGYYKNAYKSGNKGDKSKSVNPRNIELINFVDPECHFAESYRSIRTSILLSTPKKPPQVIAVTSAQPSEGKTATVANLAVSFSQLGKKVLIVDADMRKPRIHKIFKLKNTAGLSTFLVGKADLTDIIQKTHVPNVFVISSGPIPPNPVELIDSDIMQHLLVSLQEKVDFIFIDTPPLVGIVDPIIVGRYADGMILVTWGGKTHRNPVVKAKDEIDQYNIRVLGVVLNRVDLRRLGYGYNYYGKYKYQYRYKESDDAKRMK